MTKLNLTAKFLLLLDASLLIAFAVHTFILYAQGNPAFENLIVQSYVVNGFLAALIFVLLYRFRLKLRNQIGFLFMAGSLLKFVFFFLLFYPTYKKDGDISTLEFAAFFVPYALSLFWETYFVSKMLKNMEETDDGKTS
ncbi:hypothetical protein GTQ34_06755 [Muricauda sp. JGD-17]|uniref:Uncharacterized protein n=1 Tax=Flagellimonas ochracea TaxID=2696472 RepID=A0A964TCE8_9FLAO|nr:DUF6168 family protein [Allomuricauda ochracea]NAY91611.1 hypothetical protein [Allomuricauda ochracea]